jgi:hypothetical protein
VSVVIIGAVVAGLILVIIWMQRLLWRAQAQIAEMDEVVLRGGRVIYHLATRLSPHGHIDISEGEWNAPELMHVEVMDYDGGQRVLVK